MKRIRRKNRTFRISVLINIMVLFFILPVMAQEQDTFQQYRLADPVFDTAKQLYMDGKMADAEHKLNQCLALCPSHSEAHYYLGRIYYRNKDYKKALTHLRRAEANIPAAVEVQALNRKEYAAQLRKRREQLQEQLDGASDNESIQELKKNIGVIDNWLKEPRSPGDPFTKRYCNLQGTVLFQLHRYSEARQQFKKVVDLDPKHPNALKNLAVAHFMTREFNYAMECLDRSEKLLGVAYPELKKAVREAQNVSGDIFDLFGQMLEQVRKESDDVEYIDELEKFMSLYSRFSHRTRLLTPELLSAMCNNYRQYNVAIDFIEKIPFRDPAVAIRLLEHAAKMRRLKVGARELITAQFQAMLELMAHTARYAPNAYDWDRLVTALMDIPLNRIVYYDRLLVFMDKHLKIPQGRDLIHFLQTGVRNRSINLKGVDYIFTVRTSYDRMIRETMEGQGTASFSSLQRIRRLMSALEQHRGDVVQAGGLAARLRDAVLALPYADISSDAPKAIRERVALYSRDDLQAGLDNLVNRSTRGIDLKMLRAFIYKLKRDYLSFQLRDHLLSLVYAVNARNPNLKAFLNPNFVRLHNFAGSGGRTAWNYCGAPQAAESMSVYHLSGGLSRLHLALAMKWHEQLFSRSYVYNAAHTRAVITNILDMYPLPQIDKSMEYYALLVDLGLELLEKSKQNAAIKAAVTDVLTEQLAGGHYRQAMAYLSDRAQNHNLYFSEIALLGEHFFKNGKFLRECGLEEKLGPFKVPPLSEQVEKENHRYGSVFYNSFGSLTPRRLTLFPVDVSHAFQYGWMSGEMVDEFKIRTGYMMHRKNIPPELMGHILYHYMVKTLPRAYSQNHPRDYSTTYFAFEVFNPAILNRIVRKLKEDGILRLK